MTVAALFELHRVHLRNRYVQRLGFLLIAALLVTTAGCPKLARTLAETDGHRLLINGYKLALLKGFPAFILGNHVPQVLVPSAGGDSASQEVATYCIYQHWIIGSLWPYTPPTPRSRTFAPDPPCFVVNTVAHDVTWFDTPTALYDWMSANGISPSALEWREAMPGG